MDRNKRIFVSVPLDHNLDDRQRMLKGAILANLRQKGLEPQEFQVSGLPLGSPYTFEGVREIMSRCHGALILAFGRWRDSERGADLMLPTVWNHFEGAFAIAMRKEILVITERNVAEDGITWFGGGHIVLSAPLDATPAWLEATYVKTQIEAWVDRVKDKNDVFLGYCTGARATAIDIGRFLRSRGVSVKDWEIDFTAGGVILDELLAASKNCLGAIMLLTKDDELVKGGENVAAPRDNVIFEAGLFMNAKGRERVLVVLEQGAKMPADIGGGIYLPLKNRDDISGIQIRLLDFIDRRI